MRLGSLLNYINRMLKTKTMNILKPEGVAGMTDLSKEKFAKEVDIPQLHMTNVKPSEILKFLKPYLLKLPSLKPIQTIENKLIVLLNPEKIKTWEDISVDDRQKLENVKIDSNVFKVEKLELNYENFTADELLKAVLPSDQEGMASYTKIGHIIHVNLREHLLPFKKIIGQVLLDKVSGCETVVNKINMIDNTYRNFSMEILAGEDKTKTTLKQNNCTFEFDFATVYWNSRLSTEHERIVKIIQPNDVLFDVFSGVGPFSIPAAKKKCVVYANDLNPESYNWLNHNAKKNKLNMEKFNSFNMDGHDFIKTTIRKFLLQHIYDSNVHIVMNLPALAVEFLKDFVGMYNSDELKGCFKPPKVYVYCFAKGEDYEEITKKLITDHLGRDITDKMEMFRVRTVSSFKEMMRVTFSLDEDLLINNKGSKRGLDNPAECFEAKKVHVDHQNT